MTPVRPKGILERGASSDLWRNTLSQIVSVFGRLRYLASLRNPNTGLYEHHGLALIFGDKEADKALRKSHQRTFEEWLSCPLEKQRLDLNEYLSEISDDPGAVIDNWIRLAPYRNLAPSIARNAERDLFFSDFRLLLDLLKVEYGVASPDQDA